MGKSDIFYADSKIFRKSFYIVNINRFLRNFQGTFSEPGYRSSPLLGMNNHTPSPGQPKNTKKIKFFNLIFVYPRQYCSDFHKIFRSWSHNQGINNGQQIIEKIVPPLGAAPTPLSPHSKSRCISANYEPISTKFSGKLPLTRD